jgi:proline iminopeptidase
VIRFDNRDAGLSDKMTQFDKPNLLLAMGKAMLHLQVKSPYSLDDMAADAVGLLDGLGIARAHIVGASMGGMIAQIVAARYPQRVRSLTSIMSSSGRRGLPGPTAAVRSAMMQRPANPRDIEDVIRQSVKTFRAIGSPGYPIPDDILHAMVGRAARRNLCVAGVARQLVAILANGDRSPLLRTIKAPSLVIHGNSDPLVPVENGRDTAAQIPGARYDEIDGMGHDLPPALLLPIARLIWTHCLAAP